MDERVQPQGHNEGVTHVVGTLVLLIVAIVGTIAAISLVEATIRRSDIGAALVLGLLVVNEAIDISLSFNIGPVRITAPDLLFIVLITASTARSLRGNRWTTPQRLLVAFGALVFWSLVRGMALFGVPGATNEGRKFLVFVAVAFYFSTVEERRDIFDRIAKMFLVTAVSLSALTFLRWGANAAGITGGIFGDGASLRAVPSDAALLIAQGALLCLPWLGDRSRGLSRYLAPALFAVVVLLQHRTVWVIALVGVVALLFLDRRLTRKALLALGAGLLVVTILILAVFDGEQEMVTTQLGDSASSTSTFEWRVGGWDALLRDAGPDGLVETLVGAPFGSGWDRQLDGQLVSVSPHSFYLEPYLRVGLVGVILMVLIYSSALRRPTRRDRSPVAGEWRAPGSAPLDRSLLPFSVLRTLIGVQLLYFITYTPDAAQALLLGLGCAIAGGAARGSSRVVDRISLPYETRTWHTSTPAPTLTGRMTSARVARDPSRV